MIACSNAVKLDLPRNNGDLMDIHTLVRQSSHKKETNGLNLTTDSHLGLRITRVMTTQSLPHGPMLKNRKESSVLLNKRNLMSGEVKVPRPHGPWTIHEIFECKLITIEENNFSPSIISDHNQDYKYI